VMAAAIKPPKDPETAAAEKKIAFQDVNSITKASNIAITYSSDSELITFVPA
jgi:hypothetical protein